MVAMTAKPQTEPTLAEIIAGCNWDTRRLAAFHARAKALSEKWKCDEEYWRASGDWGLAQVNEGCADDLLTLLGVLKP